MRSRHVMLKWRVLPGDLCGFARPTWGGAMAVPSGVLWSPRRQGEGPCRQRVHQTIREASVGLRDRCETGHFIPVYWTGDLFPDLRLAISPCRMSKSHKLAGSQNRQGTNRSFVAGLVGTLQIKWFKYPKLTLLHYGQVEFAYLPVALVRAPLLKHSLVNKTLAKLWSSAQRTQWKQGARIKKTSNPKLWGKDKTPVCANK